jgi:hypothetical protein
MFFCAGITEWQTKALASASDFSKDVDRFSLNCKNQHFLLLGSCTESGPMPSPQTMLSKSAKIIFKVSETPN